MEREHESKRNEREKYFEAERETLRKNLGEPGQNILETDFLSRVNQVGRPAQLQPTILPLLFRSSQTNLACCIFVVHRLT